MKAIWVLCGCAACGGGAATPADLPLVTPLVRAATPAGLRGATARTAAVAPTLAPTDIRDRFFSPGPTEVFQILSGIDARIAEVNADSMSGAHACLAQAPVETTLHVFGEDVSFAAQCARSFSVPSGPPGRLEFGVTADATYLFVTGGAARIAARVTPDAVDAWYGVGYDNAASCGSFDGCSYGVTQIHADPTTAAFEMTVAGVGLGYCGLQLASDGTTIAATGSPDMGETCADAASLCANAADLSTAAACAEAFALPPLGRMAGAGAHAFGASAYPATPTIVLDGTDGDSLGFGSATPASGVGDFDAG